MGVWQIALIVGVWVAVGLTTAFILSKRGHEFGPHAALGAILGPFFVFLAMDTIRRREHDEPIRLSPSSGGTGKRVLVVAAGEVEDPASVLDALPASLGEIGQVTLGVPVEYEVAERVHHMDGSPPPSEDLDRIAEALAAHSPGRMLIPGRIEEAIATGASETGADVVLLVGSESPVAAPGVEDLLDAVLIRADTGSLPDSDAS